jgi:hypothetical protein
MRISLFAIILCVLQLNLFSQNFNYEYFRKTRSITVGFLEGGGSFIGIDFESLFSKHFGIQFGGGIIGFGGGLNWHLKPSIRSSFFSLQYWHQGYASSYTQSVLGPNFVFRAKKFFTAQIGFGFAMEEGPAYPETKKQPPLMLTYAIGFYIPL